MKCVSGIVFVIYRAKSSVIILREIHVEYYE